MQTVLTILEQTTEFLKKKGVPEPRLDAQWLLAHGLGIGRLDLYLQFDRPLNETEMNLLRDLVVRRGRREPLQHILGTAHFCDLVIGCDRRTLIPRPETEQLVQHALRYGSAETGRALEIATGSGAPILAFAQKRPGWSCIATDLSPEAIAAATENGERNGLAGRVEWRVGDLAAPIASELPFDLVISNLPYIAADELARLQPEVRDYDPRLALDGGPDGLDLVRRFLAEMPPAVAPGGVVLLEVGADQGEAVRQLAEQSADWESIELGCDLEGVRRFPIFRRRGTR